jgi:hypothetical protein
MGPWWMTVSKLEETLRDLRDEVQSARAIHPHLTHAPAIVHAEAAVERARDCLARLKPPRPQPVDEALTYASQEVARAEEAVRRLRSHAAMAGQSGGGERRRGLTRLA